MKNSWIAIVAAAVAAGTLSLPNARAEGQVDEPGITSERQENVSLSGLYKITATPDRDTLELGGLKFESSLLFASDMLMADGFGVYGFNDAPFANVDGRVMATMPSTEHGTLVWSVQLDGENISGTLRWTKSDGSVYTYELSGTLHDPD